MSTDHSPDVSAPRSLDDLVGRCDKHGRREIREGRRGQELFCPQCDSERHANKQKLVRRLNRDLLSETPDA